MSPRRIGVAVVATVAVAGTFYCVVLGVVIYVLAPKDSENQALKTLLGDQYDKLEREGEYEKSEVEEQSAGRRE